MGSEMCIRDRDTALHLSVRKGHDEITGILIEHGAALDIAAAVDILNHKGHLAKKRSKKTCFSGGKMCLSMVLSINLILFGLVYGVKNTINPMSLTLWNVGGQPGVEDFNSPLSAPVCLKPSTLPVNPFLTSHNPSRDEASFDIVDDP